MKQAEKSYIYTENKVLFVTPSQLLNTPRYLKQTNSLFAVHFLLKADALNDTVEQLTNMGEMTCILTHYKHQN